jgi:hypothetical protein
MHGPNAVQLLRTVIEEIARVHGLGRTLAVPQRRHLCSRRHAIGLAWRRAIYFRAAARWNFSANSNITSYKLIVLSILLVE